MSKKRISSLIIGLILGLVLIGLWLSFTELDQIILKIREVDKSLVLLAAVIYVMA